MQKRITLQNQAIAYTVRKSRRARRMRLTVHCDGAVVVTLPHYFQETAAERFLREKMHWLFAKINFFKQFQGITIRKYGYGEYLKCKEVARILVAEKVMRLSETLGCQYGKISVGNQKTRWGSCSKKGNLKFNYRILFLQEKIQDYLIVHELCHLKEFNHSREFWNLVTEAIPDHRAIRKELRKRGLQLRA